jgi:GYF domain 2
MYRIIGADLKEYGPITSDQICQWIAEGRANANSRAQSQDSVEWKPLSEFPEFAAALASKAAVASPPPIVIAVNPDELGREIIARGYDVDFARCISRSWELLKRHFWLVVGTSFLVSLVMESVPFIGGVLQGGLFLFFLKLIRTGKAEVGDGFSGFTVAFLHLFLAGLVSSLLISIGFLLCIIPGVYLVVAWTFALMLVADKKLDFWPAMELSRSVVTFRWWQLFALLLVNFLLMTAGFLACVIGSFITFPITVGAIAYAYEDIFGARPATAT